MSKENKKKKETKHSLNPTNWIPKRGHIKHYPLSEQRADQAQKNRT